MSLAYPSPELMAMARSINALDADTWKKYTEKNLKMLLRKLQCHHGFLPHSEKLTQGELAAKVQQWIAAFFPQNARRKAKQTVGAMTTNEDEETTPEDKKAQVEAFLVAGMPHVEVDPSTGAVEYIHSTLKMDADMMERYAAKQAKLLSGGKNNTSEAQDGMNELKGAVHEKALASGTPLHVVAEKVNDIAGAGGSVDDIERYLEVQFNGKAKHSVRTSMSVLRTVGRMKSGLPDNMNTLDKFLSLSFFGKATDRPSTISLAAQWKLYDHGVDVNATPRNLFQRCRYVLLSPDGSPLSSERAAEEGNPFHDPLRVIHFPIPEDPEHVRCYDVVRLRNHIMGALMKAAEERGIPTPFALPEALHVMADLDGRDGRHIYDEKKRAEVMAHRKDMSMYENPIVRELDKMEQAEYYDPSSTFARNEGKMKVDMQVRHRLVSVFDLLGVESVGTLPGDDNIQIDRATIDHVEAWLDSYMTIRQLLMNEEFTTADKEAIDLLAEHMVPSKAAEAEENIIQFMGRKLYDTITHRISPVRGAVYATQWLMSYSHRIVVVHLILVVLKAILCVMTKLYFKVNTWDVYEDFKKEAGAVLGQELMKIRGAVWGAVTNAFMSILGRPSAWMSDIAVGVLGRMGMGDSITKFLTVGVDVLKTWSGTSMSFVGTMSGTFGMSGENATRIGLAALLASMTLGGGLPGMILSTLMSASTLHSAGAVFYNWTWPSGPDDKASTASLLSLLRDKVSGYSVVMGGAGLESTLEDRIGAWGNIVVALLKSVCSVFRLPAMAIEKYVGSTKLTEMLNDCDALMSDLANMVGVIYIATSVGLLVYNVARFVSAGVLGYGRLDSVLQFSCFADLSKEFRKRAQRWTQYAIEDERERDKFLEDLYVPESHMMSVEHQKRYDALQEVADELVAESELFRVSYSGVDVKADNEIIQTHLKEYRARAADIIKEAREVSDVTKLSGAFIDAVRGTQEKIKADSITRMQARFTARYGELAKTVYRVRDAMYERGENVFRNDLTQMITMADNIVRETESKDVTWSRVKSLMEIEQKMLDVFVGFKGDTSAEVVNKKVGDIVSIYANGGAERGTFERQELEEKVVAALKSANPLEELEGIKTREIKQYCNLLVSQKAEEVSKLNATLSVDTTTLVARAQQLQKVAYGRRLAGADGNAVLGDVELETLATDLAKKSATVRGTTDTAAAKLDAHAAERAKTEDGGMEAYIAKLNTLHDSFMKIATGGGDDAATQEAMQLAADMKIQIERVDAAHRTLDGSFIKAAGCYRTILKDTSYEADIIKMEDTRLSVEKRAAAMRIVRKAYFDKVTSDVRAAEAERNGEGVWEAYGEMEWVLSDVNADITAFINAVQAPTQRTVGSMVKGLTSSLMGPSRADNEFAENIAKAQNTSLPYTERFSALEALQTHVATTHADAIAAFNAQNVVGYFNAINTHDKLYGAVIQAHTNMAKLAELKPLYIETPEATGVAEVSRGEESFGGDFDKIGERAAKLSTLKATLSDKLTELNDVAGLIKKTFIKAAATTASRGSIAVGVVDELVEEATSDDRMEILHTEARKIRSGSRTDTTDYAIAAQFGERVEARRKRHKTRFETLHDELVFDRLEDGTMEMGVPDSLDDESVAAKRDEMDALTKKAIAPDVSVKTGTMVDKRTTLTTLLARVKAQTGSDTGIQMDSKPEHGADAAHLRKQVKEVIALGEVGGELHTAVTAKGEALWTKLKKDDPDVPFEAPTDVHKLVVLGERVDLVNEHFPNLEEDEAGVVGGDLAEVVDADIDSAEAQAKVGAAEKKLARHFVERDGVNIPYAESSGKISPYMNASTLLTATGSAVSNNIDAMREELSHINDAIDIARDASDDAAEIAKLDALKVVVQKSLARGVATIPSAPATGATLVSVRELSASVKTANAIKECMKTEFVQVQALLRQTASFNSYTASNPVGEGAYGTLFNENTYHTENQSSIQSADANARAALNALKDAEDALTEALTTNMAYISPKQRDIILHRTAADTNADNTALQTGLDAATKANEKIKVRRDAEARTAAIHEITARVKQIAAESVPTGDADDVDTLLAIPGLVSDDDKDALEAARDKYNAMKHRRNLYKSWIESKETDAPDFKRAAGEDIAAPTVKAPDDAELDAAKKELDAKVAACKTAFLSKIKALDATIVGSQNADQVWTAYNKRPELVAHGDDGVGNLVAAIQTSRNDAAHASMMLLAINGADQNTPARSIESIKSMTKTERIALYRDLVKQRASDLVEAGELNEKFVDEKKAGTRYLTKDDRNNITRILNAGEATLTEDDYTQLSDFVDTAEAQYNAARRSALIRLRQEVAQLKGINTTLLPKSQKNLVNGLIAPGATDETLYGLLEAANPADLDALGLSDLGDGSEQDFSDTATQLVEVAQEKADATRNSELYTSVKEKLQENGRFPNAIDDMSAEEVYNMLSKNGKVGDVDEAAAFIEKQHIDERERADIAKAHLPKGTNTTTLAEARIAAFTLYKANAMKLNENAKLYEGIVNENSSVWQANVGATRRTEVEEILEKSPEDVTLTELNTLKTYVNENKNKMEEEVSKAKTAFLREVGQIQGVSLDGLSDDQKSFLTSINSAKDDNAKWQLLKDKANEKGGKELLEALKLHDLSGAQDQDQDDLSSYVKDKAEDHRTKQADAALAKFKTQLEKKLQALGAYAHMPQKNDEISNLMATYNNDAELAAKSIKTKANREEAVAAVGSYVDSSVLDACDTSEKVYAEASKKVREAANEQLKRYNEYKLIVDDVKLADLFPKITEVQNLSNRTDNLSQAEVETLAKFAKDAVANLEAVRTSALDRLVGELGEDELKSLDLGSLSEKEKNLVTFLRGVELTKDGARDALWNKLNEVAQGDGGDEMLKRLGLHDLHMENTEDDKDFSKTTATLANAELTAYGASLNIGTTPAGYTTKYPELHAGIAAPSGEELLKLKKKHEGNLDTAATEYYNNVRLANAKTMFASIIAAHEKEFEALKTAEEIVELAALKIHTKAKEHRDAADEQVPIVHEGVRTGKYKTGVATELGKNPADLSLTEIECLQTYNKEAEEGLADEKRTALARLNTELGELNQDEINIIEDADTKAFVQSLKDKMGNNDELWRLLMDKAASGDTGKNMLVNLGLSDLSEVHKKDDEANNLSMKVAALAKNARVKATEALTNFKTSVREKLEKIKLSMQDKSGLDGLIVVPELDDAGWADWHKEHKTDATAASTALLVELRKQAALTLVGNIVPTGEHASLNTGEDVLKKARTKMKACVEDLKTEVDLYKNIVAESEWDKVLNTDVDSLLKGDAPNATEVEKLLDFHKNARTHLDAARALALIRLNAELDDVKTLNTSLLSAEAKLLLDKLNLIKKDIKLTDDAKNNALWQHLIAAAGTEDGRKLLEEMGLHDLHDTKGVDTSEKLSDDAARTLGAFKAAFSQAFNNKPTKWAGLNPTGLPLWNDDEYITRRQTAGTAENVAEQYIEEERRKTAIEKVEGMGVEVEDDWSSDQIMDKAFSAVSSLAQTNKDTAAKYAKITKEKARSGAFATSVADDVITRADGSRTLADLNALHEYNEAAKTQLETEKDNALTSIKAQLAKIDAMDFTNVSNQENAELLALRNLYTNNNAKTDFDSILWRHLTSLDDKVLEKLKLNDVGAADNAFCEYAKQLISGAASAISTFNTDVIASINAKRTEKDPRGINGDITALDTGTHAVKLAQWYADCGGDVDKAVGAYVAAERLRIAQEKLKDHLDAYRTDNGNADPDDAEKFIAYAETRARNAYRNLSAKKTNYDKIVDESQFKIKLDGSIATEAAKDLTISGWFGGSSPDSQLVPMPVDSLVALTAYNENAKEELETLKDAALDRLEVELGELPTDVDDISDEKEKRLVKKLIKIKTDYTAASNADANAISIKKKERRRLLWEELDATEPGLLKKLGLHNLHSSRTDDVNDFSKIVEDKITVVKQTNANTTSESVKKLPVNNDTTIQAEVVVFRDAMAEAIKETDPKQRMTKVNEAKATLKEAIDKKYAKQKEDYEAATGVEPATKIDTDIAVKDNGTLDKTYVENIIKEVELEDSTYQTGLHTELKQKIANNAGVENVDLWDQLVQTCKTENMTYDDLLKRTKAVKTCMDDTRVSGAYTWLNTVSMSTDSGSIVENARKQYNQKVYKIVTGNRAATDPDVTTLNTRVDDLKALVDGADVKVNSSDVYNSYDLMRDHIANLDDVLGAAPGALKRAQEINTAGFTSDIIDWAKNNKDDGTEDYRASLVDKLTGKDVPNDKVKEHAEFVHKLRNASLDSANDLYDLIWDTQSSGLMSTLNPETDNFANAKAMFKNAKTILAGDMKSDADTIMQTNTPSNENAKTVYEAKRKEFITYLQGAKVDAAEVETHAARIGFLGGINESGVISGHLLANEETLKGVVEKIKTNQTKSTVENNMNIAAWVPAHNVSSDLGAWQADTASDVQKNAFEYVRGAIIAKIDDPGTPANIKSQTETLRVVVGDVTGNSGQQLARLVAVDSTTTNFANLVIAFKEIDCTTCDNLISFVEDTNFLTTLRTDIKAKIKGAVVKGSGAKGVINDASSAFATIGEIWTLAKKPGYTPYDIVMELNSSTKYEDLSSMNAKLSAQKTRAEKLSENALHLHAFREVSDGDGDDTAAEKLLRDRYSNYIKTDNDTVNGVHMEDLAAVVVARTLAEDEIKNTKAEKLWRYIHKYMQRTATSMRDDARGIDNVLQNATDQQKNVIKLMKRMNHWESIIDIINKRFIGDPLTDTEVIKTYGSWACDSFVEVLANWTQGDEEGLINDLAEARSGDKKISDFYAATALGNMIMTKLHTVHGMKLDTFDTKYRHKVYKLFKDLSRDGITKFSQSYYGSDVLFNNMIAALHTGLVADNVAADNKISEMLTNFEHIYTTWNDHLDMVVDDGWTSNTYMKTYFQEMVTNVVEDPITGNTPDTIIATIGKRMESYRGAFARATSYMSGVENFGNIPEESDRDAIGLDLANSLAEGLSVENTLIQMRDEAIRASAKGVSASFFKTLPTIQKLIYKPSVIYGNKALRTKTVSLVGKMQPLLQHDLSHLYIITVKTETMAPAIVQFVHSRLGELENDIIDGKATNNILWKTNVADWLKAIPNTLDSDALSEFMTMVGTKDDKDIEWIADNIPPEDAQCLTTEQIKAINGIPADTDLSTWKKIVRQVAIGSDEEDRAKNAQSIELYNEVMKSTTYSDIDKNAMSSAVQPTVSLYRINLLWKIFKLRQFYGLKNRQSHFQQELKKIMEKPDAEINAALKAHYTTIESEKAAIQTKVTSPRT